MAELSPHRVRERLTRRYRVALALIALAGVVGGIGALAALQDRVGDGYGVNLAGRQRMLSQQVAKAALAARTGEPHAGAELAAAAAEWGRAHAALLDGDPGLGTGGVADPRAREQLAALSPVVAEGRAQAAALREALRAGDAARADAAVRGVLVAERQFLPGMDEAVGLLSDASARAIVRLQWAVIGVVVGLMGMLGVLGQAVFRPAVARAAGAMETALAQGRLLRTVIDTIPDHIYVKDVDGRATLRNLASARALGFDDPADAVGQTDAEIGAGSDTPELGVRALADDLAVARTGVAIENREERTPGGGWLLTTKVPLPGPDGGVAGVVGVSRDVTDARAAEARFRTLVEHSVVGTVIVQDGRFAYVNPRMETIVGAAPGALDGRDALAVFHPDDHAAVAEALRAGTPDGAVRRVRGLRDDGRVVHLEFAGVGGEHAGRPAVIGTVNDVSERHAIERVLIHQAHHDELTGLPNRALFASRLEAAVAAARADGEFAVLFIDLDRFKAVNDSLGHSAGDRLLREVGARIAAALRDGDTVARLGGDEFAVLLTGDLAERPPEVVADRIREHLRVPVTVDGHDLAVGASIGVVHGRADHGSADEVLREADLAMYDVKGSGRGGHATFAPGTHGAASHRLRLELDLQHAAERGELRVAYQPLIRLADGALAGFEALVRWEHPELGRLGPDAFIGPAEQSGHVVAIDRWVLLEAARQVAAWSAGAARGRALAVSVNCTGRDLLEPSYLAAVDRALAERGLGEGALTLEITETLLVDDPEAVAAELERLRARGVRVSVDDFGTGYSTLGTLRTLPADTVKVDRSFVADMEAGGRSRALVEAVVQMGQVLGKSVVGEGVETPAQLAALRAMGCTYAQGFLFAEPLAPEAAAALVAAERLPWAGHWAPSGGLPLLVRGPRARDGAASGDAPAPGSGRYASP